MRTIFNIYNQNTFQAVTTKHQLYPACLPLKRRTSNEGIHSGWSKKIPYQFLENNAPTFTKIHGEFFKQQVIKRHIYTRHIFIKDPPDSFCEAQARTGKDRQGMALKAEGLKAPTLA